ALVRFLVPCCLGVAATLAWQSYGDAAKETVATFTAQNGWSVAWLSPARPETAQSAPVAQSAGLAPSPPAAPASDSQPVKTMTLGLAATLTTMRDRVDQLAAGQKDTANEIAKLQATEQEIQHKISTLMPRPAAAATSKPTTAVPPRALTPPR